MIHRAFSRRCSNPF